MRNVGNSSPNDTSAVGPTFATSTDSAAPTCASSDGDHASQLLNDRTSTATVQIENLVEAIHSLQADVERLEAQMTKGRDGLTENTEQEEDNDEEYDDEADLEVDPLTHLEERIQELESALESLDDQLGDKLDRDDFEAMELEDEVESLKCEYCDQATFIAELQRGLARTTRMVGALMDGMTVLTSNAGRQSEHRATARAILESVAKLTTDEDEREDAA